MKASLVVMVVLWGVVASGGASTRQVPSSHPSLSQAEVRWETKRLAPGKGEWTVASRREIAAPCPVVVVCVGMSGVGGGIGGGRVVEGMARRLAERGYVVVVPPVGVGLEEAIRVGRSGELPAHDADWVRVGAIGVGRGAEWIAAGGEEVKARVYIFGEGKWTVVKGPGLVVGGVPGGPATRPFSEGPETGDRWMLRLEQGDPVGAVRDMGGERRKRFEATAEVVGTFLDGFVKGDEEGKNLIVAGSVVGKFLEVVRWEGR